MLGTLGLAVLPPMMQARAAPFQPVTPGRTLRFPQDEGSHPEFRTEWWYVTGWLDAATRPLGFQITFFRTRPHADAGNPSRFSAGHILIAHAAISERQYGRLRHDQRAARAGFELAQARTGRTDVFIDDWLLRAEGTRYVSRIAARDFSLALGFTPTQPHLLQGDNGYSRKGPHPRSASYYYSLPQLRVDGLVRIGSLTRTVDGIAWFDHEWSSEAMDEDAVGWDWAGINLDGGAALMVFRMRSRSGGQHWAAATLRTADRTTRTFTPDEVRFETTRHWVSPRTGARYPVAMRVTVAGTTWDIVPLMDDQEHDTRASTGAIYWEGAAIAQQNGRRAGYGYLELTGYAKPLKL